MSDNNTLDLTEITSEPVESNIQVDIVDAPETDEPEEVPEEVIEPAIATPDPEPVEDPEPVIATPDPVAVIATPDPEPVIATPDPEPVIATPDPEPVETVSPAPVGTDSAQVAADIRNILTEVPTVSEGNEETDESVESVEPLVTDNLCSLKTLVEVLGKWSGGEIKRRNVEELLKEGSEVDENLDDLEKVVEILKLWIGEGGSTFREHNHFKKLDEYTLSGESRNLPEEKKVEVLKTLTELVVNVSHRRVKNGEIQNVMNNIY